MSTGKPARILEAGGASFEHVVATTEYITTTESYGKDEISAIAVLPDDARR
jgi:hypothetical protein